MPADDDSRFLILHDLVFRAKRDGGAPLRLLREENDVKQVMAGLFFVTMAVSALVMDLAFSALGLVPSHDTDVRAQLTRFSLNYTFWLDLAFGALALYLFWLNNQHPMNHGHHASEGHASTDGHGGEPAHGHA